MIVSDFCEEAALMAQQIMSAHAKCSAVEINPFRSPLPVVSDNNRLPSYANAFVFVAG